MRVSALAAPLLGAVCAALVLLLLGWSLGWQSQLGRLDPALVIPWMMPVLLWRAWRGRGDAPSRRLAQAALLWLMLLAAQVALVALNMRAAISDIIAHLVAVSIAYGLCWLLCHALVAGMRRHAALRWTLPMAATGLWLVAAHMALSWAYAPAAASPQARTAVMISGLPLRWSGSADFADIFSGQSQDDIFLTEIERLGPISLVDSLTSEQSALGATWVLAHPRALSPQDLVAVDQHVRSGGRAVIFADALSSWPAPHGFGDPRNPPITSLLTPLLDHWGVELLAVPRGADGERWVRLSDAGLRLHSAGHFGRWPRSCAPMGDALMLRCRIGKGEALLVGDADLLYAPLWQADGWDAAHLMKSDLLPWAARQIWGEGAGQALLRPLWLDGGAGPSEAALHAH